jgi:hypothetical protein
VRVDGAPGSGKTRPPAEAHAAARPGLRALRAGADPHERAAAAIARPRLGAARTPRITALASAAAHVRGLLDKDLGHLPRAVRPYAHCPRILAGAPARGDLGRKPAAPRRFDALPLLDAALALRAEAGAERDLAPTRRRHHALGLRRAHDA